MIRTMKTGRDRLDDLVSPVKAVRSYETPEIVTVPVEGDLAEYLDSITVETTERSQSAKEVRPGIHGRW